ncbi:penicillin-binding protein 1C [Gilliamella sp. Pra-s65]|uniref:penicillin-binding protein 1C n=1 Tax=unclassified Gilliamella TaxID=2685620 RepID=UPI0013663F7F|nr:MULTISPECIES: penicillin-binding protein 1C [unclassified Gilliamella]MWN89965.1 penicillin-binding protein 1C [Gilliamella sp. Pra-s65]MWP72908.1 penicillin-binding protein 1C [Gilliamella sp. Pra-s52]
MKKRLRNILAFLFFCILLLLGGFFVADHFFPLSITNTKTTQTILAEDGTPLWRFADENGVWRYPIKLDEVPNDYLDVLLNYEDRHFYEHFGINPASLLRAAWQNITNRRIISGGSTISMQVARLLYPHDRTVIGKLKQIFRTLQLELHFTKDEILTLYINRAPFGGTIEGLGAASWSYFGKEPKALTRSEAVLLAVLPQAPSRLRPDRYPQRAKQARDKVLARLAQYQVWSPDIIEQVQKEDVWVYPRKKPQLAPLLARRLSQQYPNEDIIHSNIDLSLQYSLEDIASNRKNQLPPKTSLAILVVDHTDMSVKGYVGSVDFNNKERFGQVDMISALRSPGSTLKPFMYALAIDEGMIHSESLLQDTPRISSDYRPTNFDEDFYGPISASEALKNSLNLPAVQLIELYGSKRFAGKLAGIGLPLESNGNTPNISYILGGASLRMDNLVSAYSAFARHGQVSPLRFVQNEPLLSKPFISDGSAWITRQMLVNSHQLVYKTGTSYGYRDAWAVGMNPRYLIGVWVGRPDGTPVVGQYGSITAVPILQQVSSLLLNKERRMNRPLPVITKPASVTLQKICWPSGQILPANDENCHRQKNAWIFNKMVPPTLDTLTALNNNVYRSGWITIWVNDAGKRVSADCNNAHKKLIALWPIALENWLLPKERRQSLLPEVDKYCPVFGKDAFSPLDIIGLRDKQWVKRLSGQQDVTIDLTPQGGIGEKWWFLDGKLFEHSDDDQKVALTVSQKGIHHLLLLDQSGQILRMTFTLD